MSKNQCPICKAIFSDQDFMGHLLKEKRKRDKVDLEFNIVLGDELKKARQKT